MRFSKIVFIVTAMHVFIIASITLDGFIAQSTTQSSLKWTSKEDTQFFITKTKEAGALVCGSTTFATFKKPLPDRLNVVYSKSGNVAHQGENVLVTSEAPVELIAKLEKMGYDQLAVCGGSSIYTQFLKAGVVDTLYLTIEPVIFGTGVKLFNEEVTANLELRQIHHLSDQTKVLEYQVKK